MEMKAASGRMVPLPFNFHTHRTRKTQRAWFFDLHARLEHPGLLQANRSDILGKCLHCEALALLHMPNDFFCDRPVIYTVLDRIG